MKYKDFETLKSNEDFKRVYTKRKSYANRELVMYIAKKGIVLSDTDWQDL